MKPIRKDIVFGDAPGLLGALWHNMCHFENELADLLLDLPGNTFELTPEDTWQLVDDGECLVLSHGMLVAGELVYTTSRFDFDLGWGDITEDELGYYIGNVNQAIEQIKAQKHAE